MTPSQTRKAVPDDARNGLDMETRKNRKTSDRDITGAKGSRLGASQRAGRFVVEYARTRDRVEYKEGFLGWTCYPVPPPGRGWIIADTSRDDATSWIRFRMVQDGSRVTNSEEV